MVDSRILSFSERVEPALANVIVRHDLEGRALTVAYSGGLDSTVLLHALQRIAPLLKMDFPLLKPYFQGTTSRSGAPF